MKTNKIATACGAITSLVILASFGGSNAQAATIIAGQNLFASTSNYVGFLGGQYNGVTDESITSGGTITIESVGFKVTGATTTSFQATLFGSSTPVTFTEGPSGFFLTSDTGAIAQVESRFGSQFSWAIRPAPSGWTVNNVVINAVSTVPEPSSALLLGVLGTFFVTTFRRRRA